MTAEAVTSAAEPVCIGKRGERESPQLSKRQNFWQHLQNGVKRMLKTVSEKHK